MGTDGVLRGPAGETTQEDYRYEENDSTELNQSIEQKKQELKDLEDRKKLIKEKPGTMIRQPKNDDGPTVAFSPSPVFSLVNQFN